MYDRCTQNRGNGFGAFQFCFPLIVIIKFVMHALPNQLLNCQWLLKLDFSAPASASGWHVQTLLCPAKDVVFWIQHLNRQLACSSVCRPIRNGEMKDAASVGSNGCSFGRCGLNGVPGKETQRDHDR